MPFSYPTGFYVAVSTWPTGTFGWALYDSTLIPTPDNPAQTFLSSFAAAEFVDALYARQVLTGASVSVDIPGLVINLAADDPDFGIMADGGTAAYVALFNDTGVDATSEVIELYQISYLADGVTDCLVRLTAGNALQIPMICPAEFGAPIP